MKISIKSILLATCLVASVSGFATNKHIHSQRSLSISPKKIFVYPGEHESIPIHLKNNTKKQMVVDYFVMHFHPGYQTAKPHIFKLKPHQNKNLKLNLSNKNLAQEQDLAIVFLSRTPDLKLHHKGMSIPFYTKHIVYLYMMPKKAEFVGKIKQVNNELVIKNAGNVVAKINSIAPCQRGKCTALKMKPVTIRPGQTALAKLPSALPTKVSISSHGKTKVITTRPQKPKVMKRYK